jgi:shikimate dehydrogenase
VFDAPRTGTSLKGCDLDSIVNATLVGMKHDDPIAFDVDRVAPITFVGEVATKAEYTPLLRAAKEKGCTVQIGTDTGFEMTPAYLKFLGYGTATPDALHGVSQIEYS